MAIDGVRGSGKTSLQVYFLWKNPDLPKEVNYKLDLPNTKRLEIDELIRDKTEFGLIGITESVELLDNRRNMSNLSKYMYRFASQSRKIGKDVLIDSLILETIDPRFLKVCDLFCTALGENLSQQLNKGFYYSCQAKLRFSYSKPILKCIPYPIFNQFKDLFDTYEIIEPEINENIKVDVMSSKKKKGIIDELAKQILANKEEYGIASNEHRVSHSKVSSILLDMEKAENLEYDLYGKLNRLLTIELEKENE